MCARERERENLCAFLLQVTPQKTLVQPLQYLEIRSASPESYNRQTPKTVLIY